MDPLIEIDWDCNRNKDSQDENDYKNLDKGKAGFVLLMVGEFHQFALIVSDKLQSISVVSLNAEYFRYETDIKTIVLVVYMIRIMPTFKFDKFSTARITAALLLGTLGVTGISAANADTGIKATDVVAAANISEVTQEKIIASKTAVINFARSSVTTVAAPKKEEPKPEVKAEEAAPKTAEEAVAVEADAVPAANGTAAAANNAPAPAAQVAPAPVKQNAPAPAQVAPAPAAPAAPAPVASNLQGKAAYQQYAAQELTRRGLNGPAELQCLIPIWERESNWNPNAANPSSTARGIPQMMMNIHYGANWQTSAAGVAYLTNPQVQIDKGLDYIAGRYGTPCNAWQIWQTQHWY